MAEQKKKKGRAARADLYVPQAGGGFRYIGKYYRFAEGQELTVKKWTLIRTALCVITGLAVLGSGLLNSPGMHNTAYVIIPFMGSFICAVAMIWAAGRAAYHGVPLKEYVFDATVLRLKGLTIAQAVFSVLAAAGEILFLFLSSEEEKRIAAAISFAALQLVACAAALILRAFEKKPQWEKTDTNAQ